MRVLISAYACNPYSGSELGNGFNWPYYTAKNGNEVFCFTQYKYKSDIERFIAVNPQANLHFVYVKVPEFINKLYKIQIGVYIHYLSWQYYAYKSAKEINNKKPFDVVHHVTWGSLVLGTLMYKLNRPLIFGPVGGGQRAPESFKKYFFHWWKSEERRNQVHDFFIKLKIPHRAIKKSDMMLVSNRDTYELAQKIGAKNVKLTLDTSLPDDFYPTECPVRDSGKNLKILWIGRIFALKGLPLVLEALSKVNKEVSFELTILGDGPVGIMVPNLIKNNCLEGRVHWKGQVPWSEVKQAYKSHDLLMFCSLRDSGGAQLLEGMAYGLPIITLNIHGSANVPDNASIKVEAITPEKTVHDLARAVEWMSKNGEERLLMGRNGYSFAKSQTWTKRTEKVQEYYESLTS